MSKKCDKDKVLNPESGRCVKRDGALGKKILQQIMTGELKSPKKTVKTGKAKSAPPGKILNPATNKYVLVSGKIGKAILEGGSASKISKDKKANKEYSKFIPDVNPPRFYMDTVNRKTYEIPGDFYKKYTGKELLQKIKEYTKKKDKKDTEDYKRQITEIRRADEEKKKKKNEKHETTWKKEIQNKIKYYENLNLIKKSKENDKKIKDYKDYLNGKINYKERNKEDIEKDRKALIKSEKLRKEIEKQRVEDLEKFDFDIPEDVDVEEEKKKIRKKLMKDEDLSEDDLEEQVDQLFFEKFAKKQKIARQKRGTKKDYEKLLKELDNIEIDSVIRKIYKLYDNIKPTNSDADIVITQIAFDNELRSEKFIVELIKELRSKVKTRITKFLKDNNITNKDIKKKDEKKKDSPIKLKLDIKKKDEKKKDSPIKLKLDIKKKDDKNDKLSKKELLEVVNNLITKKINKNVICSDQDIEPTIDERTNKKYDKKDLKDIIKTLKKDNNVYEYGNEKSYMDIVRENDLISCQEENYIKELKKNKKAKFEDTEYPVDKHGRFILEIDEEKEDKPIKLKLSLKKRRS
jgi:hypothetical protein